MAMGVFIDRKKGGSKVLEITWKLFKATGNIDTYLLLKEIENDVEEPQSDVFEQMAEFDTPTP